ncbi:MAG TPA: fluoride efflux transporter CrcB [Saprospiraceae bacterium]|nr:fluoride efflux transporter CrcB [Saprospiraceae bacterium]
MAFFWVFMGGGLGSICRYGIARGLGPQHFSFPWATFAANLLACAILGFLVALNAKGLLKSHLPYLLMTGFCGGFSTFSTFAYESFLLFQNGQTAMAFANMLGSFILGLLGIYLGLRLGGYPLGG